ncbi:MAG TPA: amidohydrolase family protein [Iamia sp.]|nr:amidohydrolase family protein [Iamia sp.]
MGHDLVIRGGTVADGTGAPTVTADVAIDGDRITAVGRVAGRGATEIDADGALVTPGWVDIHTHYDGQVTWDDDPGPSAQHGVTTVVMGNCGVGFAPCPPDRRDWLVGLMEGVEDIPGSALHEGISWEWETYPEYLDALDRREWTLDVGSQIAHGAVRAYVMGERGARNEPATPEDIAAMSALVEEAVRAGALGVTTSRTIAHRAIDGEPVPGTYAAEDELLGLGQGLARAGSGVFELAPVGSAGEDLVAAKKEVDWMRRVAAATGRPVTFALLQVDDDPELWREMCDLSAAACDEGASLHPQVAGRPTGMLAGLDTTYCLFTGIPAYDAIADLPVAERVARMRDPEVRAAIVDPPELDGETKAQLEASFESFFALGDPPDYEPGPERSIAAVAAREGRSPLEVAYDAFLAEDGTGLLYLPILNYSQGTSEPTREMLLHPAAVLGLGDGGAHVGFICDGSTPTWMLTHWTRDRSRGEQLPLELVVRRQTGDTAALYGLGDRGRLEPGLLADVNVIDHAGLRLHTPRVVHDLPAGGRRLLQGVDGYLATVKSGVVTRRYGERTGATPGRLVRGAR